MKYAIPVMAALLATPALAVTPVPPRTAADPRSITIIVTNVRNDHGHVIVAICPADKFLATTCPYSASAPAHPGTTTVTFVDLPPGDWAAQSFHDENNNREIDRALFGIPKEGVGFSRDAKIRMGPPKWADATFHHEASPQVIHFGLRYFMGPSGPEAWSRAHTGK